MRSGPTFFLLLATAGCDAIFPAEQPAICDLYVTCTAEVLPSELGDIQATYGPNGTCWSQGADLAATCTDACTAGVRQDQEFYPTEPSCFGPIPEGGCAFEEGTWSFTVTDNGDYGDALLSCDDEETGSFSWEFPRYPATFACRPVVDGFSCQYETESIWGGFGSDGRSASGETTLGSGNGFTAELL